MVVLSIGQVAEQVGVTRDTIRLYERYGLIEEPKRAPNGYRQYSEDVITRLRFIKDTNISVLWTMVGVTIHCTLEFRLIDKRG